MGERIVLFPQNWTQKEEDMDYTKDYKTIEELEVAIREYINWYNKRIKTKLNGLSPVEYRLQAV